MDSHTSALQDSLFMERFDVFLQKNLGDIATFAQKEGRSLEEIRRRVAEWHLEYLFQQAKIVPQIIETPVQAFAGPAVNGLQVILTNVSNMLESYHHTTGHHSFFLVVDPATDVHLDDAFLGGTTIGREFWRGLRAGGAHGARAFKEHCKSADKRMTAMYQPEESGPHRRTTAPVLRSELYSEMRTALREACGIRNAEMKWSKPSQLEAYGVQLIGWPTDISFKNPSAMSIKETKQILELLKSRQMYFHYLTQRQSLKHAPVPTSLDGSTADCGATNSDLMSNLGPSKLIDTSALLAVQDSSGPPNSDNHPAAEGEQVFLADLSIRAPISPNHMEFSSVHSDQGPRPSKRPREGPA